ncbi:unnamed protein product [Lactuca saligna]|uniref:Uncharacterized protein n=1 Tax=Lactuca saligna TaxID=75948 RepID=A0AA35YP48_LACSI|nr:unnamed protein product [Lactuca saligna]
MSPITHNLFLFAPTVSTISLPSQQFSCDQPPSRFVSASLLYSNLLSSPATTHCHKKCNHRYPHLRHHLVAKRRRPPCSDSDIVDLNHSIDPKKPLFFYANLSKGRLSCRCLAPSARVCFEVTEPAKSRVFQVLSRHPGPHNNN